MWNAGNLYFSSGPNISKYLNRGERILWGSNFHVTDPRTAKAPKPRGQEGKPWSSNSGFGLRNLYTWRLTSTTSPIKVKTPKRTKCFFFPPFWPFGAFASRGSKAGWTRLARLFHKRPVGVSKRLLGYGLASQTNRARHPG